MVFSETERKEYILGLPGREGKVVQRTGNTMKTPYFSFRRKESLSAVEKYQDIFEDSNTKLFTNYG